MANEAVILTEDGLKEKQEKLDFLKNREEGADIRAD